MEIVGDRSLLEVEVMATEPGVCRVIRRNKKITPFDKSKIFVAISKAFLAVEKGNAAASPRIREIAESLTREVTAALSKSRPEGGTFHIEHIQDLVELALMRNEHHRVAREYVLYREARAKEREQQTAKPDVGTQNLQVVGSNGQTKSLDLERLKELLAEACEGIEDTDPDFIFNEVIAALYDGMAEADINSVLLMSVRPLIEREPNYSRVCARLLMDKLRTEAFSFLFGKAEQLAGEQMRQRYPEYFVAYMKRACELELLDPKLLDYDIERLGKALDPGRDLSFTFLGLQTLYDRYFFHSEDVRFELPQAMFMRVAMGLASREADREKRAIEFYELLSSFRFMSSTPTLFNAGTRRSQLSSCYLTTVPDDLHGIYTAMRDNALLSKYAGGLGNDWSAVRALGSRIKSTNGKSQGVVPFLKVVNDTAVAVNQGGKRKGAVCAYLETWHLDIEEFLELRKNSGDDRRRTHDMNTANWIPDLFMQRVTEDGNWTLFSPADTPDLHELYGRAFVTRYQFYEQEAKEGRIKNHRTIGAVSLWRKMLGMLYETGHPWITFKDPCNIRSPQGHVGVVHSSNLCTEITLNTSDEEIAVCNLGSVNLSSHIKEGNLDAEKLQETIQGAMRMLDNVIDINYYSVSKAETSNMKHRPVGLGLMGFQDTLYQLRIPLDTEAAVEFADRSMELVSYYAIEASADLASERGSYPSYSGSLWDQGILPVDSLKLLAKERNGHLETDSTSTLDWDTLREKIKSSGMRNSNTLAIAPTATISNICGVTQSVEPTYQHLFVKSNLSGEFTVVNEYLVKDLKVLSLWDDVMMNDLKYYNGSVRKIERVPESLKKLYPTAFEADPFWLVEAAARRQKWIDQSQSLNLYMDKPSGKKMDALYRFAWVKGLKTTYYLRSLGASDVEASTVEGYESKLNAVPGHLSAALNCALDGECEACE